MYTRATFLYKHVYLDVTNVPLTKSMSSCFGIITENFKRTLISRAFLATNVLAGRNINMPHSVREMSRINSLTMTMIKPLNDYSICFQS